MTGTMTWVGLDVHARSIHAAAVDCLSGELSRARFSGEVGPVVEWLVRLRQPVRACDEAGPTGYVLSRAATAAGLRVEVVAPTKTPRPRGDRVKSDRKDAQLLVRQLMAGALTAVVVPDLGLEAARDLSRCREQLRLDLARARQRASQLLLRHGRVSPRPNCTWSQTHWRWLRQQRFEQPATELA